MTTMVHGVARIQDLELAVDRMKQQQETLQKKLKDEADQKAKLEVGSPRCSLPVSSRDCSLVLRKRLADLD